MLFSHMQARNSKALAARENQGFAGQGSNRENNVQAQGGHDVS
jgi:hypothetical protein